MTTGAGHDDARPRRGRYVRSVDALTELPAEERARLRRVTERYAFRLGDYYRGLIDWQDPADPLRRLVIPDERELGAWDALDLANEEGTNVARAAHHKYDETVLVLCADTCGAYCRYCNRKRLFMEGNAEVGPSVDEALRYVAASPHVDNVLLTGGDPLMLGTRRLLDIVRAVRAIPHVRIIRIGTKIPAFDPARLYDDRELLRGLGACSRPDGRVYIMTHFDHPRELTDLALAALGACLDHGLVLANQCALIRGVNDDPAVLAELFARLSFAGCPQYYLFQCAPVAGNEPFEVPLVEAWQIFRSAMARGSGLARRTRFVMSHERGKVEIVGIDARYIYLRYHQATDPADLGRVVVCRRRDDAHWLDQLEEASPDR